MCNIGTRERRQRYGLAACCFAAGAVYLAVLLVRPSTPPVLALGLFVPFSLGIEWYLQGRRSFCATLGFTGRYDFRSDGGDRGRVTSGAARTDDRRYAFRLTLLGILGGLAMTVLTYGGLLVVA